MLSPMNALTLFEYVVRELTGEPLEIHLVTQPALYLAPGAPWTVYTLHRGRAAVLHIGIQTPEAITDQAIDYAESLNDPDAAEPTYTIDRTGRVPDAVVKLRALAAITGALGLVDGDAPRHLENHGMYIPDGRVRLRMAEEALEDLRQAIEPLEGAFGGRFPTVARAGDAVRLVFDPGEVL
jgi:hypothetical protein